MPPLYRLADDGETPIQIDHTIDDDMRAWSESIGRRVAQTYVGRRYVSTVFLGADHQYDPSGPPLLWESMTFGPDGTSIDCERYSSLADARAGHAAMVAKWSEEADGGTERL